MYESLCMQYGVGVSLLCWLGTVVQVRPMFCFILIADLVLLIASSC